MSLLNQVSRGDKPLSSELKAALKSLVSDRTQSWSISERMAFQLNFRKLLTSIEVKHARSKKGSSRIDFEVLAEGLEVSETFILVLPTYSSWTTSALQKLMDSQIIDLLVNRLIFLRGELNRSQHKLAIVSDDPRKLTLGAWKALLTLEIESRLHHSYDLHIDGVDLPPGTCLSPMLILDAHLQGGDVFNLFFDFEELDSKKIVSCRLMPYDMLGPIYGLYGSIRSGKLNHWPPIEERSPIESLPWY